jgi:hypothetical protein
LSKINFKDLEAVALNFSHEVVALNAINQLGFYLEKTKDFIEFGNILESLKEISISEKKVDGRQMAAIKVILALKINDDKNLKEVKTVLLEISIKSFLNEVSSLALEKLNTISTNKKDVTDQRNFLISVIKKSENKKIKVKALEILEVVLKKIDNEQERRFILENIFNIHKNIIENDENIRHLAFLIAMRNGFFKEEVFSHIENYKKYF